MRTSGPVEERRNSEERLLGLRIVVIAGFCLLAVSFWLLQVVQHQKYREIADNQYQRTIPLRAPRGIVVDRDGRVLVENRSSFTISIVRERVTDLDETIRRLAQVTQVDEQRIRDIMQRRRREPLYRPIAVIEHATFEQVAAVTARRRDIPAVYVQQVPARTYPAGLAAHLFGYVGEIQESQLSQAEYADANLQPGAIIGQAGMERVYNSRLMGLDGNRFVVVNSSGREIEELQKQDAVIGERLQLTLDLDLQRALEEGFRDKGFNGAAVIMDPRTGEVLAMTSLPSYDPNQFAVGMDSKTWAQLIRDPLKPMNNRLVQGTYSPGSTFKMVVALAALEEKIVTPQTTFYCPGHATFYGRPFKCWKPGGHGAVDMRRAIEQSCNVYFYNLGDRLGVDRINKYAAMFGLVGKTGIDLPGEVESLVPSTAWKQRVFKDKWYAGETISVAIGQGAVSVTPLALGTMIATIANGGTLITPHVARAFDAGDGKGWQPVTLPPPRSQLAIAPENLQAVRDGLWLVVNGAGTGGRARIAGRDVSGKTGTAQVVSNQNKAAISAKGRDVRDHGWFVFFAPRDNPRIAGVVIAEHGEHGSEAAPIAKYVMETFFAKQDGQPLPKLPPKPGAIIVAAPPAPGANASAPPARAASGVGTPTETSASVPTGVRPGTSPTTGTAAAAPPRPAGGGRR